MPQFADHFQVERNTFVQAFRLIGLADLPQEIHLRPQVDIDLPDSGIDTILRSHEEVGRIDVQFILLVNLLSGLRIERRNTVDLVVPELDAVGCPVKGFDSRKDIDRIAVYAKAATIELYFIIDIKGIHETAQQFIPVYPHPLFHMHHLFGKSSRVRHTIEAGDRRNDNDILPPRQQRSRCTQAEFIDLVINRQILFYISIRCRQVGFRLVVIVIRDEILDGIVREECLELAIQLGSEGFVMTQYQGRFLHFLDHIGDSESLSGPCYP